MLGFVMAYCIIKVIVVLAVIAGIVAYVHKNKNKERN